MSLPTDPIVLLPPSSASSGPQINWAGGMGIFAAVGTWGGATASLQFVGPDGSTLISAGTATNLTSNGAGVFYLPRCKIQATVTNAGQTTSIAASAYPIPQIIG